jgi:response regulator of citrate/malate metabolism
MRIRVLVVEDDRQLAEAHRPYVERLPGFDVVGVVHAGGETLRFVAAQAVDLILLDFYLPDMSGLDVCRTATPAAVVQTVRGAAQPLTAGELATCSGSAA